MGMEDGSSNPFPDKPSSYAIEISEDESWLDSCLELDHFNDAADNLRISTSRDSHMRPTEDLSTEWMPLFAEIFPEEDKIDENEIPPFKRELQRENAPDEFRTLDLVDDENPSSTLEPGAEDDLANIFRVWDLNTGNPELEKGTLTDILTSSLAESPSGDGVPEGFYGSGGLNELSSSPSEGKADLSLRELEKGMKEPQSVESLIAALSDLNISVNRQKGFEGSRC